SPAHPVETDLVADADSLPSMRPEAKPEPKKFELPPYRPDPPRAESKPELVAQPSNALALKTSKVTAPGPPATIANAGRIAPPPELAKAAPPPVISNRPEPIPQPAKPGAAGDRSLTRVLGLKLGRVVLDPGHGGHDVVTHGPSGLLEKD